MKQIHAGVVTITNSSDNYGNVLQNYAVIQYLKQYGIKCETINNLSYAKRRIGGFYILPKMLIDRKAAMRSLRFQAFRIKYLNYSRGFITERTRNYKKWENRYALFICGSDQIWNPEFKMNHNWDVNLLRFVTRKPKVAFSASIGIDHITPSFKELLRESLISFDGVSVREISALQMIDDLTVSDATRLLDPVMLLDTRVWERLAKPVKELHGRGFVLKYWLGIRSGEEKDQADYLNGGEECVLVDVTDRNSPFYYPSPEQFVWLIKNCRCVVTDSFHAAVFSILFHKQLYLFNRITTLQDMSSRISTLLDVFKITDRIRYIDDRTGMEISDWRGVDTVLHSEREKADLFWREILQKNKMSEVGLNQTNIQQY